MVVFKLNIEIWYYSSNHFFLFNLFYGQAPAIQSVSTVTVSPALIIMPVICGNGFVEKYDTPTTVLLTYTLNIPQFPVPGKLVVTLS